MKQPNLTITTKFNKNSLNILILILFLFYFLIKDCSFMEILLWNSSWICMASLSKIRSWEGQIGIVCGLDPLFLISWYHVTPWFLNLIVGTVALRYVWFSAFQGFSTYRTWWHGQNFCLTNVWECALWFIWLGY